MVMEAGLEAAVFKKGILLLVAGVACYLIVDPLVVTDRERLEALMERGRAAVEAGDDDALEPLVAEDYRFEGRTRPEFLRLCRGVLKKFAPMKVRFLRKEIRLEEDGRASVLLTAVVTPRPGSEWPGPVRTEWVLHFVKEDESWRVSGVKPLWR